MSLNKLVDAFLAWPLPASVRSDLCVTKQGAPHRIGTNLLSADEAKQMIEYLLATHLAALTLRWSTEKPTKPGWYWWRYGPTSPYASVHEWVKEDGAIIPSLIKDRWGTLDFGEFAGPLEAPQ